MVDELSFLYNDDEKLKYIRIKEKASNALKNYSIETVCFLDPFWQEIAIAISNEYKNIKAVFFDGIKNSESKLLVFSPWYMELDRYDYISLICFDNPYSDIKHSDVLGKILSLGIDRQVIGDIVVDRKVYIAVSKPVENFILSQLRNIKRHDILPYVVKESVELPKSNYVERVVVTPSLRLDAVVSKIYNISRTESQKLISQGFLKIDYRVLDKATYELDSGCLISLRGFGRVKISGILGKTQKGNIRLRVERLV